MIYHNFGGILSYSCFCGINWFVTIKYEYEGSVYQAIVNPMSHIVACSGTCEYNYL